MEKRLREIYEEVLQAGEDELVSPSFIAAQRIYELEKDKARLDWMETKRNVLDKGSGDYRFVADPGETRKCIDAAILQDNNERSNA